MKKLILLGYLVLWTFVVQAQENIVTGKVSDESGVPIPGVNILVKGTTVGTTTDAAGEYSLAAPANGTLIFSFIGYESKEVAVGTQSVVNVDLTPTAQQLNEVVVVGYGTQKRKDLTGSIARVTSDEFVSVVTLRFVQATSRCMSLMVSPLGQGAEDRICAAMAQSLFRLRRWPTIHRPGSIRFH